MKGIILRQQVLLVVLFAANHSRAMPQAMTTMGPMLLENSWLPSLRASLAVTIIGKQPNTVHLLIVIRSSSKIVLARTSLVVVVLEAEAATVSFAA